MGRVQARESGECEAGGRKASTMSQPALFRALCKGSLTDKRFGAEGGESWAGCKVIGFAQVRGSFRGGRIVQW